MDVVTDKVLPMILDGDGVSDPTSLLALFFEDDKGFAPKSIQAKASCNVNVKTTKSVNGSNIMFDQQESSYYESMNASEDQNGLETHLSAIFKESMEDLLRSQSSSDFGNEKGDPFAMTHVSTSRLSGEAKDEEGADIYQVHFTISKTFPCTKNEGDENEVALFDSACERSYAEAQGFLQDTKEFLKEEEENGHLDAVVQKHVDDFNSGEQQNENESSESGNNVVMNSMNCDSIDAKFVSD